MNKKEVLEIKKTFSPENCIIDRICGCYVNSEKEIVSISKDAFLSLPEEESFKYFDIFKKTLSGSIGKKLLNLDFPIGEEEKEDGTQKFLYKLNKSELKDDDLNEDFFYRVINGYEYATNYYIILIHCVYDVPGKATDGSVMFDSSDDVHSFLLCSICPVDLSKASLSYNKESSKMEDRVRDWIVGVPMDGFMFPAFNDRSTDIHSVLYYTKKTKDLQDKFIQEVLGIEVPFSSDQQMESFNTAVSESLGDECNVEIVKSIQDNILAKIEEHKDDETELKFDENDLESILYNSNVSDDKIELFKKNYTELVGNKSVDAKNIVDEKNFTLKNTNISLKVKSERLDLVKTDIIDGRKCLVVYLDETSEANGLII